MPSPLRCSSYARCVGVDPVGTAPRVDDFVLVEHPLPWPKDIGDDPTIAAVAAAATKASGPDRRVRVQGLVCDVAAPSRRVMVCSAGDGAFHGFDRRAAEVAPAELVATVEALVQERGEAAAGPRSTDVLLCTHGTRDTCCGSLGTRMWRASGATPARLWRTSHTGGHRFAPTALTFPGGHYWAYLEADLLVGIVEATLDPEVAAPLYRGCAAFEPVVQAADRAAFLRHGWEWFAWARSAAVVGPGRVHLSFRTADGTTGTYEATVEEARRLPIPDCGFAPELARKSESELRVRRFELVD